MATRRIGLTTTIPVEIIFAAGAVAVDLNNLFVASELSREMVARAEREGFSQNTCAWVKGLYAAAKEFGIHEIVGVVEGDCSQNAALLDIWKSEGFKIYHFSFPASGDKDWHRKFSSEVSNLCKLLGADPVDVLAYKKKLDVIRAKVALIDRQAVSDGNISSAELFEAQLAMTDFDGDIEACSKKISKLEEQYSKRPEQELMLRLGVVGVPTILSDLWDVIDGAGARVVYHEVPHQFSLAQGIGCSLEDAFAGYTYTAGASVRVAEINRQAKTRKLDGLIHYTQSFCHRQLHDIILRREADIPVLTIEADRPGAVDGRTRTRIEAFLEQLSC